VVVLFTLGLIYCSEFIPVSISLSILMLLHDPGEIGILSPRVEHSDACAVVLLLDIVFAKTILFSASARVDTIIEVANTATNNAKDICFFIFLFILFKSNIKLMHNYNYLSKSFYIFIFVNHDMIIV
jgi:hypothetical protein